jgi:hypothetical protein
MSAMGDGEYDEDEDDEDADRFGGGGGVRGGLTAAQKVWNP